MKFTFRPRSYTTVFVSLFVFVLIVAITFLIGLGVLTDGFKHLTGKFTTSKLSQIWSAIFMISILVEERCRDRWSSNTKPSITSLNTVNSNQQPPYYPHSAHPRPALAIVPQSPPSSPSLTSSINNHQNKESNLASNVCLTPDCVRIGEYPALDSRVLFNHKKT